MSAIPSRRRRRAIAAVVTGVISMAVLPAGLVLGANRLLNEKGGDSVDDTPTQTIPVTPTALLAVTDARNEIASLAMFALDPSGKGGSIVSIPVGANAEIPKSGTIHRVSDTFATAGIDGLRTEVEGLLNVSFNLAAAVNAADLGSLLSPAGNRSVNFPAPVMDVAADGTATQIVPAGQQDITPVQMAASLAATQPGIAESTRWPLQKAVWEAVVSAAKSTGATVTSDSSPDTPAAEPADMAGYVRGLLEGGIQYWQLSAKLLTDATQNPANADLYEMDGGEVIMVMASIAPSAVSIVSSNMTVMLDTPYDDTQLVREAVVRLSYVGANVVAVRTIDAPPGAQTEVYCTDEMVRADVQGYSSLLGEMAFPPTTEVIEGINARIVLGETFRTFIGSDAGRTIASTTTVAD